MSSTTLAYAIIRPEKAKTLADLASRAAHNLRATPAAAPNADPAKKDLNRILQGPETVKAVVEAARRKHASVPKFRKDAVLAVEILMTASPEFFDDKPSYQDIEPWMRASTDWARTEFCSDNIISMALHLDEATPHVQLLFVPIHEGKLRASHWFDGPKRMSELQSRYAEAMKPFGLIRGEKGSRANHISLKRFYEIARSAAAKIADDHLPLIQIPQRHPDGRVREDDWRSLERDIEKFNSSYSELHAILRARNEFAASTVGREAKLRAKRAREEADATEARLAALRRDLEAGQGTLVDLQKEVLRRRRESGQLDVEIQRRLEYLASIDQDRKNSDEQRQRG